MTPDQLKQARRNLGLNLAQMAWVLGYETHTGKSNVQKMECDRQLIMPAQRRLVELYLAGARPPDWGMQYKTANPEPPTAGCDTQAGHKDQDRQCRPRHSCRGSVCG